MRRVLVGGGLLTSWAVPDHSVFVDELPKTSVGTIDTNILRNRQEIE